jgi:hypothetical protein
MEDELLYMCPEASRLFRPCEHPIRMSSPRAREKLCPECRPPAEAWPLVGATAIGYFLLNLPLIIWLLLSGLGLGVLFVAQKIFGMFPTSFRFLCSALQWFPPKIQILGSTLFLYTHRLAVLTKTIVCTHLWPAVKSTLWWTIAIAMTPFVAVLAFLEILEDGLWPQLPKLFWKIVDFSTGEVFKFYAIWFLALSYFIFPASSVTKWLEMITIILAPFQVSRLYTWYRDEAWDRLGDRWAASTLSAVSIIVLISLIMTAPHASVLVFLNRWVYATVFVLAVAEPVRTFLGMLYYDFRTILSQLMRQEMVQRGFGHVGQEVVQNRLAWIWQIILFRNWAAPAYKDNAVQTDGVDVRHKGPEPVRLEWQRRGSYERVRPKYD